MKEVTVEDMMACRERRAARQEALLRQHGCPLVSFTLNIAGSVKSSPLIERAFDVMAGEIHGLLKASNIPVLSESIVRAPTGPEMLMACRANALSIKKSLCVLEEKDAFGRLMDIDVIGVAGKKIDREQLGLPSRKCLICGETAAVCARSRRHSVEELSLKTEAILNEGLTERVASIIGEKAQWSLLTEVIVTPKPGLVDCRNNGAHRDMTMQHFIASACALRSYFEVCFREGAAMTGQEPSALMERLRLHGIPAEQRMLRATGGVNTHKGAIYGLGILCGAAGCLHSKGLPVSPDALLGTAGQIARCEMDRLGEPHDAENLTGGIRQYLLYGAPGARGQASEGFPAVRNIGLPALTEALGHGKSLNDAAIHALLHLMALVEDTNVFKRAGRARQLELMRDMAEFVKKPCTRRDVQRLDDLLIKENISPGGCADLLAFTLFVHRMSAIG